MEMSIDTAISWLLSVAEHEGEDIPIYDTDVEAIKMGINIMHKYQKIQEVLEKVWNTPSCMLDESECLNKIMETYRTVR